MKPIIMSGNHPKLILDGIKTQTRRVIKPQPDLGLDEFERYHYIAVGKYHPTEVDRDGNEYPGDEIFGAFTDDGEWGWKCSYGQVGDRLWVRETWATEKHLDYLSPSKIGGAVDLPFWWKADLIGEIPSIGLVRGKWRPSIHMPRWASRITLEITEVRVEKLCDITVASCMAEGLKDTAMIKYDFKDLWDSLNAKRGFGWSSNCWVWCLSFKVV